MPSLAAHRADDVEELSDVQLGAQLVPHPPDGVGSADEELVGKHERQVADEDRRALAEPAGLPRPAGQSMRVGVHGMRRRLATTARGVVHHVVVEQGEGMHQFERRPCVDHALIVGGPSGADEAPLAERWAEALASGLDHSADLVERPGQVGVERCPAPPLGGDEADHPVGDPRRDRRQARWRRGGGQPGNRHASADAGGPSRSAMTSSMRDRAAPMRCRHTSISVVALATRSASWSTSTSLASSSPRICSNSASALA